MRDPRRINGYCDQLAAIWHMVPDWRLSQLMVNAMLVYNNKYGRDAFYAEDDEFLKFLNNFISEATNET